MQLRTQQIKASVAHTVCAWLELAEKRQHRRVRMWGATISDKPHKDLDQQIIYPQGANHDVRHRCHHG
jgi:hypothetical protein